VYHPLPSPVYRRAPIIEAIIDLRTAPVLDEKLVEKISKKLAKRYPNRAMQHTTEFLVDGTGGNVAIQQKASGFQLTTDDQADIAIVGQNGLVAARLPPYPGWDIFRSAARANFFDWRQVAPAHPIVRIGVRYINRIDIPTGSTMTVNLDNYLTMHPKADAFERPLHGFMVQATIPTFLPHWSATLTTAPFQPNPIPGHISIVLDIEVFRTSEIPASEENLWVTLDESRIIKNDLFERALTPAAKELFRA
jgi:uncharacterized protein (TIGR04255 family)